MTSRWARVPMGRRPNDMMNRPNSRRRPRFVRPRKRPRPRNLPLKDLPLRVPRRNHQRSNRLRSSHPPCVSNLEKTRLKRKRTRSLRRRRWRLMSRMNRGRNMTSRRTSRDRRIRCQKASQTRIGRRNRLMQMRRGISRSRRIWKRNQNRRLKRNKAPKRRLQHSLRRHLRPRSQHPRRNLCPNPKPSNLLARSLLNSRFRRSPPFNLRKRRTKQMPSWRMLLNNNNNNKKI